MVAAIHPARLPDESVRAYIYRVLVLCIDEMVCLPGEKLVEADVAARLGVSRTPVHGAFLQLEQANLLLPGPRGAVVPPLRADGIRQQLWMHRTLGEAVLSRLYTQRPQPGALAGLEDILAAEYTLLGQGSCARAARLNWEFLAALYRLAGLEPVFGAIGSAGSDLYRLYRLFETPALWEAVTQQHAAIISALTGHDHEGAVAALNAVLEMAPRLLQQSLERYPLYIA